MARSTRQRTLVPTARHRFPARIEDQIGAGASAARAGLAQRVRSMGCAQRPDRR